MKSTQSVNQFFKVFHSDTVCWFLVQAQSLSPNIIFYHHFRVKSFVWYGRRCVVKQINILLPCVDDSQRSYTSEVQLQYDEPLYNQVVGRLIMDGIYAPINSKIYRNNCEITRPRYSKHILPVPLPFVISRFQCGAFSLARGWLNRSNLLP